MKIKNDYYLESFKNIIKFGETSVQKIQPLHYYWNNKIADWLNEEGINCSSYGYGLTCCEYKKEFAGYGKHLLDGYFLPVGKNCGLIMEYRFPSGNLKQNENNNISGFIGEAVTSTSNCDSYIRLYSLLNCLPYRDEFGIIRHFDSVETFINKCHKCIDTGNEQNMPYLMYFDIYEIKDLKLNNFINRPYNEFLQYITDNNLKISPTLNNYNTTHNFIINNEMLLRKQIIKLFKSQDENSLKAYYGNILINGLSSNSLRKICIENKLIENNILC